MSQSPVLLTSERGHVRVLTLNRPSALNALSRELARALVHALQQAHADPAVRAVILTGAGERAFCAGVDLREAVALAVDEVPAWFTLVSECYRQVLLTDKPVITALNGVAAGGGYQIALVSDWRIGHTRTRMTQPEINAGLPSIMGSYLMGFYLPFGVNQELSYSGRLVHAEECKRLGLLNELCSPDELEDTALARANDLSSKSTTAWRATKQRFRAGVLAGFDAARAAAIEGLQAAYRSGEPQLRMQQILARQ
jgi:enoyl-CoA hydratase/carnithine racemase